MPSAMNNAWNKAVGVLLRRYYQNDKAREIIAKADRSFAKKEDRRSGDGIAYSRITKLVRKLAKIFSDAVGFFIDDLQMTKEEAILHEFLKILPHKEFVQTGRTVTLDDGTLFDATHHGH